VIPEIDPKEAQTLLDSSGAVALDVRERWEWQDGHIRHALHIPLDELTARLHELPQDRTLVAVCRSGSRSGMVVEALRQRGYDIVNLAGGLLSWHAAGLPLEAAT
jgi:rhodanese-related sulfurtransferase